jgi:phage terminase small subunit
MLQYANSKQLNPEEARMAALANSRHEAFAQHRFRGLTQVAAAEAAGYPEGTRYGSKLDSRKEVKARIAEIKRALPWGGSRNLAPVIDALVGTAKAASKLNSAAGMKAAGDLWRQVAELKQKLPEEPDIAAMPDEPMTAQEWLDTFQPKA